MKYIMLSLAFLSLLCLSACQQEQKPDAPPSKTGVVIPKDGSAELKSGGVLTKDGVLLNYIKAGNGPKTLIVPNAVLLVDDFRSLSNQYTVISYDVRNRGRSMGIKSAGKLQGGIQNDLNDLEAIRAHFEVEKFSLVGHSYLSMMAALYAIQYPDRLEKMLLISPITPLADKTYSGAEAFSDSTSIRIANNLATLEAEADTDPEFCKKWWNSKRILYVANLAGANYVARRICRYPNEQPTRIAAYMDQYIMPSIDAVRSSSVDFSQIQTPTLIIHGAMDRVNPQGASKDWEKRLPNAELKMVENAGHLPWIEQQGEVLGAIRNFLN